MLQENKVRKLQSGTLFRSTEYKVKNILVVHNFRALFLDITHYSWIFVLLAEILKFAFE